MTFQNIHIYYEVLRLKPYALEVLFFKGDRILPLTVKVTQKWKNYRLLFFDWVNKQDF